MKYDPSMFGKRLATEVSRADLSIRELEEEVKAVLRRKGQPKTGASRGNLSTWVRGMGPEVGEPRRSVVDALAEVFSSPGITVRPEYLLYGGARTVQEAAVEEEARARTPAVDFLRERIPELSRLPYRFTVALLDHAGLRAQLERQRRRAASSEPLPERSAEDQREELLGYAGAAWEDIAQPLAGSSLASYGVFNYLDAAIHARNLALRVPMEALEWETHLRRQEQTDG